MNSSTRGPSERSLEHDPVTGRAIWRLTNSQMEDKHTYYDICPWSADGKYLVFSSADAKDLTLTHHDNVATDKGLIYVMDTATWAIRQVADGAFYTTHTGAFPLWHPTKHVIYYSKAPHRVAVLDITTGRERVMEGGMRQLSPDGRVIVFPDNEDDYRMGRGIYAMNEDGSDLRRLVSTEELYELTPNKAQFRAGDMTVGNTKWTPDGKHMLVAMWVYPSPKVRRSIYVISADGTERRWLTFFGHHHSWTPDGKQVLYSGFKRYDDQGTRGDPRLYLIDFDGTDNHVAIDQPLGGHPIMDPTRTMITTWDDEGIVLARVPEQTVEHLAVLRPGFDMSHRGTHPHPLWSADGKSILYNSAHTGHSQIYQMTL